MFVIYDNWSDRIVRSGVTYQEAEGFLQANEPPCSHTGLPRYNYWPEPSCPNCGGTSNQPEYVFCGMCREMGCPLDRHS